MSVQKGGPFDQVRIRQKLGYILCLLGAFWTKGNFLKLSTKAAAECVGRSHIFNKEAQLFFLIVISAVSEILYRCALYDLSLWHLLIFHENIEQRTYQLLALYSEEMCICLFLDLI
jgi:hypothetical protein